MAVFLPVMPTIPITFTGENAYKLQGAHSLRVCLYVNMYLYSIYIHTHIHIYNLKL